MAAMFVELFPSLFLFITIPLLLFIFIIKSSSVTPKSSSIHPKSYPIIGSYFSLLSNRHRLVEWTSDLVHASPTNTYVIHRLFGVRYLITGNPANVEHILKSHFDNYTKGYVFKSILFDVFGKGMLNTDGQSWKNLHQITRQVFSTGSLRDYAEHVLDPEISQRLVPVLYNTAFNNSVLDLQDILQRFSFDNICRTNLGYDPGYLLPSLPETKFSNAFDEAVKISYARFSTIFQITWKIKRVLSIGSEKRLKLAVSEIRKFAQKVVNEKKTQLAEKSTMESFDLLSRFLVSGHYDENSVTDMVVNVILAGRDTTSASLTWFFWLLAFHKNVQHEIHMEIKETSDAPDYKEMKSMMYTHAALCESMRLYPPVALNTKTSENDDVLPDGTVVRKGDRIAYNAYAMGRSKELWGEDWAEFRPERWLERDEVSRKWNFVPRDPFSYPVFQAGPRICLGKEMAFLQMKSVVASILRRFAVVPVAEEGFKPVLVNDLTVKMKGGFPVRIKLRKESDCSE